MRTKYPYVLVILLVIVVYETYLIISYTYEDFRINAYIASLEDENLSYKREIADKERHVAYIRTNAYVDRMAKSSQNRKNPSEEVVFLVDEKQVADTKKIDTFNQITTAPPDKTLSKTAHMTHQEKWWYYLFGVDGGE